MSEQRKENLNLAAIEQEIQRIQAKYPHLKKLQASSPLLQPEVSNGATTERLPIFETHDSKADQLFNNQSCKSTIKKSDLLEVPMPASPL